MSGLFIRCSVLGSGRVQRSFINQTSRKASLAPRRCFTRVTLARDNKRQHSLPPSCNRMSAATHDSVGNHRQTTRRRKHQSLENEQTFFQTTQRNEGFARRSVKAIPTKNVARCNKEQFEAEKLVGRSSTSHDDVTAIYFSYFTVVAPSARSCVRWNDVTVVVGESSCSNG